MIHPDTEIRYVNETIGVGVFATKFIPKGTIVWIKDDLDIIFDEEYIESLDEVRREYLYKYTYEDDEGEYVLNWDHARYINHSFNPNMVDTAYDFELAARDIHPGEQLTCDYAAMCEEDEFECVPEEGTTRTKISPDDYLIYYKDWDEMAKEAFKFFNKVEQPLKFLIGKQHIEKVDAVANGTAPMDSYLILFEDEDEDE